MSNDIRDKIEMMSRAQLELEYLEAEREIERLKRENEQLKEALNWFVTMNKVWLNVNFSKYDALLESEGEG